MDIGNLVGTVGFDGSVIGLIFFIAKSFYGKLKTFDDRLSKTLNKEEITDLLKTKLNGLETKLDYMNKNIDDLKENFKDNIDELKTTIKEITITSAKIFK